MEINKSLTKLLELYNENKIAHAYLLETNDVIKCLNEVKKMLKIIFKDIENINELIDKEYLPSLKIINTLEKNIKKEDIDLIQKSFALSSQYTSLNVYIIVNPEKMNSSAYNKLLKFLEEPEENIIGFFITNAKENIASTIISRCEIIKVIYANLEENSNLNIDKERYSKIYEDAKEYINKIELEKENIILYNNSVILKKYANRNDLTDLIKVMYKIYFDAFHSKNKYHNNYKKLKIISTYLYKCQYNVNLNLFLDSLTFEIGELND